MPVTLFYMNNEFSKKNMYAVFMSPQLGPQHSLCTYSLKAELWQGEEM